MSWNMTPAQIDQFARKGAQDFAIPEAAEALLRAGMIACSGSETRARARRALAELDPDVPFKDDPLLGFGLAVAVVVVGAIRALDPRERARLNNLIGAVTAEAARLGLQSNGRLVA